MHEGRPTLTIGCTFSDRIEALLDGRVHIERFESMLRCVEAQTLFRATLNEAAFDIAELSMGSHIAAVAQRRRDYVGVPVFLSRSFRHANLYVRTDRGIDGPADLAGKRIGLVDFQQTAALWLRGMLADDHGVARESIDWVTAGLHAPVLTDRMAMDLPAAIRATRSSSTLDAMLADGSIDAVISPTAPCCFTTGSAAVRRLWSDYCHAETDFWHRTRLFPIMHILVVRRSLTVRYPHLTTAVYDAFARSLELALADLATRDFPKCAMPWLAHCVQDGIDALGEQPWTYGLERNRAVLGNMLRYAVADGLCDDRMSVEALFD
ncbi:ABC transporter substrate-binding protein [Sphingomonas sp. RIT328]|uniref:ABC transporter substrate-binding protein n=1 Tax=Sphingomonas sp. RIT328 TaxID=1470591 RepID=UPI00044C9989|nr:ABC transporter substrate-binding protein [Sphingomonas sp. RIT328]EZP54164.1 putative 4,5-dihydroxyphthalate decarboxylase [Sphingomonas sp. RIT328]